MEKREISAGERALSSRILDEVQQDEKHWKDDFDRMRKDARYASGKQWPDDIDGAMNDMVVINILQRHVQQSTAAIYAKNPKAVASRRRTMDYAVWDETAESLAQALQLATMAREGQPVPPEGVAEAELLIKDATEGTEAKRIKEKIGRTLELIYDYELKQQDGDYKQEMKQLVRRVRTKGIGYVKLGYCVPGEVSADEIKEPGGYEQQLTHIQELIEKGRKENADTSELEADELELKLSMEAASEQPRAFREGLHVTFPESETIIPDRNCTNLIGFIGCRRVTHRHTLTADEIQTVYGRDIEDQPGGELAEGEQTERDDPEKLTVYEVWDKNTGLVYEVADGVEGFLRDPMPPDVALKEFWPFETLAFNSIPGERLFPQSDVELLRSVQDEYNRTRQAYREHRWANRPGYFVKHGAIDDKELATVMSRRPNDIIRVNLAEGSRVQDVLEAIATKGIDPNQYTTHHLVEDVSRVTGTNEPSFTGDSNNTATGDSIAESARMSSMSSNVDDLEDFLTRKARKSAQILFARVGPERAKKIAGRGAVWPQLSVQDIADEISLVIQAGSSGRPNKAAELQNFERLAPTLLQIPGVNPVWLLREAVKRMDDGLDISEALAEHLPSIVASNSMKQVATGDPMTSPEQQGGQGGLNAQQPQGVDAVPTPTTPQSA